jgi:hypothetical protein
MTHVMIFPMLHLLCFLTLVRSEVRVHCLIDPSSVVPYFRSFPVYLSGIFWVILRSFHLPLLFTGITFVCTFHMRSIYVLLFLTVFFCNRGISVSVMTWNRFRCPCGLRCRSSYSWLLGFLVRTPLKAWMFVSFLLVLCRQRRLWRADLLFREVLLGGCQIDMI